MVPLQDMLRIPRDSISVPHRMRKARIAISSDIQAATRKVAIRNGTEQDAKTRGSSMLVQVEQGEEQRSALSFADNDGLLKFDFNHRCDYLPSSTVPFWYISELVEPKSSPKSLCPVNPKGSRKYLCGTCRHINFSALIEQQPTSVRPKPQDYIVLGPFQTIVMRQECGFCRLVVQIVTMDADRELRRTRSIREIQRLQDARLADMIHESYYLCPVQFKTEYHSLALYICSGKDISEATKHASALRPRESMAFRPYDPHRIKYGRRLRTPDQLDIDWIGERLRLCDERSVDMERIPLNDAARVIDVEDMCIVKLDAGMRYVTLSYTWGDETERFVLKREMEAKVRKPGQLREVLALIPETICDSIELVRRIGERYFWVDSLCIFQDDPLDRKNQIADMGNIYTNSILTVCVCVGEDAWHGLPGMEPGTRKSRQAVEAVGGLVLGTVFPSSEQVRLSKWSTRGWVLQEKVLSQRKLMITEDCARWWYRHAVASDDENCKHVCYKPGTRHKPMFFYDSEHDMVASRIGRNDCNMDTYAFVIADYTSRNLRNEADAEKATLGIFDMIRSFFGGFFLYGLPDTELGAALLWCPLGSSRRRVDPRTGQPLFPSWSWLGWVGRAAYPWLLERSMPMSERGSPLEWKNMEYAHEAMVVGKDALEERDEEDREDAESDRSDGWEDDNGDWFTGDEYRLHGSRDIIEYEQEQGDFAPCRWRQDTESGWTYKMHQYSERSDWTDATTGGGDGPGWLHPVLGPYSDGPPREYHFCVTGESQLHFRTLMARFTLDSKVRVRKEKHDYLHSVHQVRILNSAGFPAGYIYVPDPATTSDAETEKASDSHEPAHDQATGKTSDHCRRKKWMGGVHTFIVLSRASTNPDPRIGQELLDSVPLAELASVYSMPDLMRGAGRLQPVLDENESDGIEPIVDEKGHFDTRLYDASTPWGLFNVMMLEEIEDKTYRQAIGRIHVAAFMEARPRWKYVVLD